MLPLTDYPTPLDPTLSLVEAPPTKPVAPLPAPADSETVRRVEHLLTATESAFAEMEADYQRETPAAHTTAAPTSTATLSVVMPVYNERATLEQIVERVLSSSIVAELVIVDDGSTDGTRELLEQWRGRENICVVLHEQNQGKGAALRTGFAHATGDLVIVQDADLEYDPRRLRPTDRADRGGPGRCSLRFAISQS